MGYVGMNTYYQVQGVAETMMPRLFYTHAAASQVEQTKTLFFIIRHERTRDSMAGSRWKQARDGSAEEETRTNPRGRRNSEEKGQERKEGRGSGGVGGGRGGLS